MPNSDPLWELWSSRNNWKGWVAPPAINAPPAVNALPAGDPDPHDSKRKVPRWPHAMGKLRQDQKVPRQPPNEGELEILFFTNTEGCPEQLHTKGVLLRNGPSHPAPTEMLGDIHWREVPLLWKSPRHGAREHPHDAETEMGYQLPPLSWWTKATPWEMADWSRQWGEAQTTPVKEKMWTLSAHHNLSPTSSSPWVRKSPLQQALMWETASFCCQHQCHHHPHLHLQKAQSAPFTCLWLDRVAC